MLQVTKYVPPTRDGEIERWRVTYADGEHEDMESFEVHDDDNIGELEDM